MHPSMRGVIVNKVIVAGLLAFLLTASTDASAYVAGTFYFPGDTLDPGDGRQIRPSSQSNLS